MEANDIPALARSYAEHKVQSLQATPGVDPGILFALFEKNAEEVLRFALERS